MPYLTERDLHDRKVAGNPIAVASSAINALELRQNAVYTSVFVNGVFITLDSNEQGARNVYESLRRALDAS